MDEDRSEAVAKAEVESKIPLNHQQKAFAELEETVSLLERRLEPVLTPREEVAKEAEGAADKAADPPMSPMARQVHRHNQKLNRITARVNNILRRLEV